MVKGNRFAKLMPDGDRVVDSVAGRLITMEQ